MEPRALRSLLRIVKETALQEAWNVVLTFSSHGVRQISRTDSMTRGWLASQRYACCEVRQLSVGRLLGVSDVSHRNSVPAV